MVTKIFEAVKLTKKTIFTDNFVCKLHHNTTRNLLIACQILATAYNHLGNPVICTKNGDVGENLMDTWCWNQGVYTLPEGISDPWDKTKIHHAWYKWSWIMFLAQALLFYVPRFIWKNFEGGKIESLMKSEKDDKDKDKDKKEIILDGVSKINPEDLAKKFRRNFHSHGLYATKLFFCEILNLVHVVGELFWLDYILGGKFLMHGPQYVVEAMNRSENHFTDRMKNQTDLIYQGKFLLVGSCLKIEDQ